MHSGASQPEIKDPILVLISPVALRKASRLSRLWGLRFLPCHVRIHFKRYRKGDTEPKVLDIRPGLQDSLDADPSGTHKDEGLSGARGGGEPTPTPRRAPHLAPQLLLQLPVVVVPDQKVQREAAAGVAGRRHGEEAATRA